MFDRPNMSLLSYHTPNLLEAGVDEAGRGPLFGRLYVAAAILPPGPDFNHSLMRDSKKLTERQRMIAYDYIRDNAIDYHVTHVEADVIDRVNIYRATQNGMHEAVRGLLVTPQFILVDGDNFPVLLDKGKIIPHKCIPGGDDQYTAIAAASILAKVERDNYIYDLCRQYPSLDERYGFSTNKGYGTKKHIEGIRSHGITKEHRKTFGICKEYACRPCRTATTYSYKIDSFLRAN